MRNFLVVGFYEDDHQRFADSADARTPEEAESIICDEYPGVVVAGVVELIHGEMVVVA